MILRIILFNELKDFLPQGGVRRRPKKVPLSFSALARGALQAPGCAEDRHSPPAGLPEGRRRQWCARRIDDERTWVKQRDTKGSWIVDRGSWIEDPKCPVLPGIPSTLGRASSPHSVVFKGTGPRAPRPREHATLLLRVRPIDRAP